MATHVHIPAMVGMRLRRDRPTASQILLQALTGGLGAFRRQLVRRRAAATLRQLDDHLLADIGLTRADIDEAVDGHGAAYDRRHRLG